MSNFILSDTWSLKLANERDKRSHPGVMNDIILVASLSPSIPLYSRGDFSSLLHLVQERKLILLSQEFKMSYPFLLRTHFLSGFTMALDAIGKMLRLHLVVHTPCLLPFVRTGCGHSGGHCLLDPFV